MAKSKNLSETETGPGASPEIDFQPMNPESEILIDKDLIEALETKISDKKEEIKSKVYAVSFTKELLEKYENFINDKAEWTSTEAIGVKEISKTVQKLKKEGVNNGVVYMGALPLEATHYFISKSKGKGLKEAEAFLELYKPFDQALSDAKKDASEIKDLEKQLAAAMQGVSLG